MVKIHGRLADGLGQQGRGVPLPACPAVFARGLGPSPMTSCPHLPPLSGKDLGLAAGSRAVWRLLWGVWAELDQGPPLPGGIASTLKQELRPLQELLVVREGTQTIPETPSCWRSCCALPLGGGSQPEGGGRQAGREPAGLLGVQRLHQAGSETKKGRQGPRDTAVLSISLRPGPGLDGSLSEGLGTGSGCGRRWVPGANSY